MGDPDRSKYFVQHGIGTSVGATCATDELPNSWLSVDLGADRKLMLEHYCLRTACYPQKLRNWVLEGSVGSEIWNVLHTHNGDTSLAQEDNSVADWRVDGVDVAYRHFRIRQTGRSSDNSLFL